MTVIAVLTCCCVPNFIQIGSHVRPPDAYNCRMFNSPLLGNDCCHGNRIMGTCRVQDGIWPPKLGLSRSIGRRIMTFWLFSNMAAVRHFEFKKKLIFVQVTVIVVLICVCLSNFIKIGSCVRSPDAHNCWMYNLSLLGNSRCHGNSVMADMSGTWCDVTTQLGSQSVHW